MKLKSNDIFGLPFITGAISFITVICTHYFRYTYRIRRKRRGGTFGLCEWWWLGLGSPMTSLLSRPIEAEYLDVSEMNNMVSQLVVVDGR